MLRKVGQALISIPGLVMFANILGALSVEMYVPSMPRMLDQFQTTQALMQFTISISLVGSSIFTPWLGPLSDAIGRRRIFISCQVIYCLSALLGAISQSIEFFLLMRLAQGISATAAIVLGFPIIKDIYQGRKVAMYFAYFTMSITFSLIFAPLVGGFFATYASWRYAFVFLATLVGLSALQLYLYLPETLKERSEFSFSKTLQLYFRILGNPGFIVLAIIPSFAIGAMIAFVTNGAFYYIGELKYDPYEFSMIQCGVSVANATGSYIASRVLKVASDRFVANIGMLFMVIGTSIFLVMSYILPGSAVLITLSVAVFSAGLGGSFGALTSEAMDYFPRNTGAASSMLTFVRGLGIALCVWLGEIAYNGALPSIAWFIFSVVIVCALMLVLTRHTIQEIAVN